MSTLQELQDSPNSLNIHTRPREGSQNDLLLPSLWRGHREVLGAEFRVQVVSVLVFRSRTEESYVARDHGDLEPVPGHRLGKALGFGVWGLGPGVWGVGCGMWGVGFGGWRFGLSVQGSEFSRPRAPIGVRCAV